MSTQPPEPDPIPDPSLTSGDPLSGDRRGGDAPPPPPPAAGGPRRFTRSSSDKLVGGVAGGLGRYFGIDPILFRIAFVVLSFAGGVGLLAYVGLLVFVPDDDGARTLGQSRGGNAAAIAIVAVAALVLLGPPVFVLTPALLPLGLLVLVGIVIWRAAGGEGIRGGDPARVVARLAIALVIGIVAVAGFLAFGAIAALGGGVAMGILAVVAGIALIGTAFVGGPRWLILPALALVLPLAIVAAANVRLDGGVGGRQYRPASTAELRPDYRLGLGDLTVDLRDVKLPAGPTELHVRVGVGQAVVRVPETACVTSDVQVGVGHAGVLNRTNDGLDVAFTQRGAATGDAPRLHITGDVGIGALEIRRGSEPLYGGYDAPSLIPGGACP
jgi:phage shock protein PspC (stress-responsive transcriptional regulator)